MIKYIKYFKLYINAHKIEKRNRSKNVVSIYTSIFISICLLIYWLLKYF